MANKILGIVNFEPAQVKVEGLGNYRPVASTSVLGRYRVIDFPMSNFSNSGIQNIAVFVKDSPRSLIQHIGETNYNINSKRGSVKVLPPDRPHSSQVFNTDIRAMMDNIQTLEEANAEYVVIAPSHFIYTQDFSVLVDQHVASGNDITILYQIVNNADTNFVNCDKLEIDENGTVKSITPNLGKDKKAIISLETYVMSKQLLLDIIYAGLDISAVYSLRDTIVETFENFKVGGVVHGASAYCINSLMAFYNSTMHIRKENDVKALVNGKWPIYTASADECPTLYQPNAIVKGSIVGNGCKIDGTVINSVIGSNVVIKKGAVVEDAIILPNSVIDENVHVSKAVVDKYCIVSHAKSLKGKDNEPLYLSRRDRV